MSLHLATDEVDCDCERGPCGGVVLSTTGPSVGRLCAAHRNGPAATRSVAHASGTCGRDMALETVLADHVDRSAAGYGACTCGWREWVPLGVLGRRTTMQRLWREHLLNVLAPAKAR